MFGGPVSPEYSGEFLRPFAFSYVHTFVHVVEDSVVANFNLAIGLKIIG